MTSKALIFRGLISVYFCDFLPFGPLKWHNYYSICD